MKSKQFAKFILTALTIFSATFLVNAQSGSLDPSFGSGGIVTGSIGTGGGNRINKVVIQELPPTFEPKLVVAAHADNVPAGTGADFYVLRYNSNGSLDSSFGSGGVARIAMSPDPDNEEARGLAIQADGKIVVAGKALFKIGRSSLNGFAVTRLNPDGSLDTSFGSNGRVLFNFVSNQDAGAGDVAIQSNGAIVVTGKTGEDFAAARLLPTNGAFDSSFNGTGRTVIKVGKGNCGTCGTVASVQIQPNGEIVIGGINQSRDWAIVRLTPAGVLDPNFGGGKGIVTTDFFGATDFLGEIALDGPGNIVAVGRVQDASGIFNFAVARYLPNGQLDAGFNGSGKFVAAPFAFNSLTGVAIDGFNRINATGRAYNQVSAPRIAVLRLNPNGTPDTNFGGTGMVFTSITGSDEGDSIVIQPDGRIVVAGLSNGGQAISLVRYLP